MSIRKNVTSYLAIALASILPLLLMVLSFLKDTYPDVNVPLLSPSFMELLLKHEGPLLELSAATAVLLSVLLILHYSGNSQIPVALAVLIGGLASWAKAWHSLEPQVTELPVIETFTMIGIVLVSTILPIAIEWTHAVSLPKGTQARLLFLLGVIIIGLLLLAAFFASPYGILLIVFFSIDFVQDFVYVIILTAFVAFTLTVPVAWVLSHGDVNIKKIWRDVIRSIFGK